jgi:hypothetical protein
MENKKIGQACTQLGAQMTIRHMLQHVMCAWLPACGMCLATITSSLTCAAKNALFITPYYVVIPPYYSEPENYTNLL